MIGRIYAIVAYQIYKLFCRAVAEKKFVFMYFHYKSTVDNDTPGAWPVWTPGELLVGFIKRSPIHCSRQNMKALGLAVSEEKILFVVFFQL